MSIVPSPPYTLTNGTNADATQVMANFNSLVSNVNAHAAESGANTSITSLGGLTTPITIGQGGTGQTTAALARAALGAAETGANSSITSLTGLTTPLPINEGGTGQITAALARAALGADAGTGLTQSGTTLNVAYGTTSTTATAGNDSRVTGALQAANNLSDVTTKTTAYSNLIAGSMGPAQQGILFSLSGGSYALINSFPAGAAGPTGSRSATGTVSISLGTAPLTMGYVQGQSSENTGSGDGVTVCPPTGTMAASNAYTFHFRNASSKVTFDADRVLLLFY